MQHIPTITVSKPNLRKLTDSQNTNKKVDITIQNYLFSRDNMNVNSNMEDLDEVKTESFVPPDEVQFGMVFLGFDVGFYRDQV